jgi:hypothetical protein
MALAGKTPREACVGRTAKRRRIEPRPKWPHQLRRSSGHADDELRLAVSYIEGRKLLPVIDLKRAANYTEILTPELGGAPQRW